MSIRREEEERRNYQNISSRGNRKEFLKKDQVELEGTDGDEFKDINPVHGCLVPCLKCCIYPCRAFFLTGKCISQKRRMKKVKYSKRKPNNSYVYSYNSNGQKPQYNQFYSASSNIGTNQNLQGSINTDGPTKGNLRHPSLTGNCITPICSGSSASFCTIQAEYPSNRRSVLPSSSSYGPRRYVEKTDEMPVFNESNKLTCYCLGNSNQETKFEERCDGIESNPFLETVNNTHPEEISDNYLIKYSQYQTNEFEDCLQENSSREYFNAGKYFEDNLKDNQAPLIGGNLITKGIFSSCTPCEYSDHVSLKYSQGNCFVDN
ncbi:uncharacterized protein cubi_01116 [Cryptosporidium ubiquitum]|uniref:Uncharacterized protein n=1 Tax=Cryptosporidium ubiquitum TaxID=857276 RepID=A0A1J4MJ69_9CRYT|nr:uncharacterized protein cubi_01116 [Cryptosporidium ubiquitum]OII74272.1 hypothetical protein cubi_01116 [Cryptosporidium ubiquitum]